MDFIDKITLFNSCMFEVYILYSFYSSFFDIRPFFQNYRKGLFLINLVIAIILYYSNFIGNVELNLITVPIIFWFYSFILFDISIGDRFIYFLISFMIFWGCEFLFEVIFKATDKYYKHLSNVPFQFLIVKLLIFILIVIMKQFSNKSRDRMDKKLFWIFLCIPVASFGIMMGMLYSSIDFSVNIRVKIWLMICVTLMMIGNILMFYGYTQYSTELYNNMRFQVIISKQNMDLSYYMQLKDSNQHYEDLMHNINHYMKMIGKFAKMGNCDNILKIVNELYEDMESKELIRYSNHHVLNAVLTEKHSEASNKGVFFDVYVEPGSSFLMVSDSDLIAMLGNLLDNSIKAASECERNRYVKICIFMQSVGGFCVIKVLNGYQGNIQVKEGNYVSSKKEEGLHGLGMQSVTNMAEKYGGCLCCNAKDGVFEAILLLSTNQ